MCLCRYHHSLWQVEKTEELMEQTKQKAIVLTGQASDVIDRAKSFIQAADKQLEALRQGKSMVAGATITADKAFSALRCRWLVSVVCPSLLMVVSCKNDA